jgi:hypothetical protein
MKLMDFKGREICTDSSYLDISFTFLRRLCRRGRERSVVELILKRESQASMVIGDSLSVCVEVDAEDKNLGPIHHVIINEDGGAGCMWAEAMGWADFFG